MLKRKFKIVVYIKLVTKVIYFTSLRHIWLLIFCSIKCFILYTFKISILISSRFQSRFLFYNSWEPTKLLCEGLLWLGNLNPTSSLVSHRLDLLIDGFAGEPFKPAQVAAPINIKKMVVNPKRWKANSPRQSKELKPVNPHSQHRNKNLWQAVRCILWNW